MELPANIQSCLDRTRGAEHQLQQAHLHRGEAYAQLGEAVRTLRESAGLSIRQVAEASVYSPSYIGQLEQGVRRFGPESLWHLVRVIQTVRERIDNAGQAAVTSLPTRVG